jgi:hypothetical protein
MTRKRQTSGALVLFWSCLFFDSSSALGAGLCDTGADTAITTPAPVKIDEVVNAALSLKEDGKTAPLEFHAVPVFKDKIRALFQTTQPTSKLHQFFHALHLIGVHTKLDRPIVFSLPTVRRALEAAKVFPNPKFFDYTTSVRMRPVHSNQYQQYAVDIGYSMNPMNLPLNNGKGFGMYRDGKCQLAKSLTFYGSFSFRTRELDNGNLLVYDYKNVDLYGEFGAHTWLIDVDLNYVALEEIEFLKGTNKGRVKCYVSRKEFEINNHSTLLKIVTSIVPDNSVQVIDW